MTKMEEAPASPACTDAGTEPEPYVEPLPELPEGFAGTSTASNKTFQAEVSNKAGYMCHIHVEAHFDIKPEQLFAIFTNPDNAGVFRDIKGVGHRSVAAQSSNYRRVEVEQIGELRVMWMARQFSTYLTVTEDARDPEHLVASFELLKSDVLSKFSGRWDIYPVRSEQSGKVVGCRGVLNQDILPKGMPSFMKHMPVLGGLLRGISLRAVTRLIEDVTHIVNKVQKGKTVQEALDEISRQRGHKLGDNTLSKAPASVTTVGNGKTVDATRPQVAVTSFAVDDMTDSEEDDVASDEFYDTDNCHEAEEQLPVAKLAIAEKLASPRAEHVDQNAEPAAVLVTA